jgi:hypothetical protein
MRDADVLALNARNAQNVATLYRQFIRMDAWQQAVKRAMSERSNMLLALRNPAAFWQLVDTLQQAMLAEHERRIQESAEQIEAERKKPKLAVVNGNGKFH